MVSGVHSLLTILILGERKMTTRLLTVNEVCRLYGFKPARIYQLTRDGLIPFVLIGERQYRYSESAIEEFISRGGNRNPEIKEVAGDDEK